MITVLLGLSILTNALLVAFSNPILQFPLQFFANVVVTSHQIEETSEFPPRYKRMTVYYDYIEKRARADIEAGYEAAKMYFRRYDEEIEYMVRLPPIDDCKRAYLGETMPAPDINDFVYAGEAMVNDVKCNYFLHEDFDSRVHIYMDADTGAPVQLTHENTENGVSTPLLTYDYSEVQLGPIDKQWFELPESVSHASCKRTNAGFPYLHIFHYFVKF